MPCSAPPCHALLCPALTCPTLPCPALSCPALPCPALPCPALPYPTLPYPALSDLSVCPCSQIYGESLCSDVPYKTLLLSVSDSAAAVVVEMLQKYGKYREDPADYCLVQVSTAGISTGSGPARLSEPPRGCSSYVREVGCGGIGAHHIVRYTSVQV